MKVWTLHTRPGRRPELVAEAWSFWALLFGPLWLLAHRAWIAAVLVVAGFTALTAIPQESLRDALGFALWLLVGLSANDLRRWSLGRRGFAFERVVAARDADGALLRLLDQRADLASAMMRGRR